MGSKLGRRGHLSVRQHSFAAVSRLNPNCGRPQREFAVVGSSYTHLHTVARHRQHREFDTSQVADSVHFGVRRCPSPVIESGNTLWPL